MLLVDDREPEVSEDHAFLNERMRADRDVDRSLGQGGQRSAPGSRFVAADEKRDAKADACRQRGHALVMLAGENLGRGHYRRLPACFDHVGHRQERDDGLARSHIALQEPQHALLGSEIGADVVQRLALSAREREGQGGFEAPRQSAFSPVRAAGNDTHARPHEQKRELVGEQFVIGEPRRRGTSRVDIRRRLGVVHRTERLGEARQVQIAERLLANPLRQSRQPLERALRGARDGTLKEAVRQSVDRLDRGQSIELLGCHHLVGMNHLAPAIPELDLAGNPARRADRQPRAHPFMIGEEEDQFDVACIVLDQHLERRPGARVWRPMVFCHPGFDGDDRSRNRIANLGARTAVDDRLRQVEENVEDPRALRLAEQPVEELRVFWPDPGQGVGRREQGIESRGTHHAPLAALDRPGKTDRFQSAKTRKPARGKWTTISPTRSSRRRMAMCCAERDTISP